VQSQNDGNLTAPLLHGTYGEFLTLSQLNTENEGLT
jgi:hypothetical protein